VLQRRNNPLELELEQLGSDSALLSAWTPIPQTNGLVFCDPGLQLTLRGKLAKIFFRIPAIYGQIRYADGRLVTQRLVPDTAVNGLLVNYLPTNGIDFLGLFQHRAHLQGKAFRLLGEGLRYYQPQADIHWLRIPYELETHADRQRRKSERKK
jgi:hypothetical protein